MTAASQKGEQVDDIPMHDDDGTIEPTQEVEAGVKSLSLIKIGNLSQNKKVKVRLSSQTQRMQRTEDIHPGNVVQGSVVGSYYIKLCMTLVILSLFRMLSPDKTVKNGKHAMWKELEYLKENKLWKLVDMSAVAKE
jgi:hypothetical protein